MALTEQRINQLLLPINRCINHLRSGTDENRITAELIGKDVGYDEVSEIIALAKFRIAETEIWYRNSVRKQAAWAMIFGVVMLSLAFYLASGDVPGGRQGRLIVAFLVGGGAFLYGAYRWIDPSYRDTSLF